MTLQRREANPLGRKRILGKRETQSSPKKRIGRMGRFPGILLPRKGAVKRIDCLKSTVIGGRFRGNGTRGEGNVVLT